MSRYRFLRSVVRCDALTAAVIALLNWMRGYPANEIRFMHITIDMSEPRTTT